MSSGGSKQQSTTEQKETQLSIQQAEVVKQRQADYEEFFKPEILEELREADLATTDQPTLRRNVEATNLAADQAESKMTSSIAQRGLEGSGAEIQGLAALGGARQNALSRDFFAAQEAAKNRKDMILQMGAGLSPQPTTAAPLATASSSSGDSQGKTSLLGYII